MKLSKFAYIGFLVALLASCSEELVSKSDGKETAIVYGVLNASENVHYIRINKAIFGGGNALEIATIPDSSYYDQVDAKIKEYQNGTLKRTWTLEDTLIENKEPGVFYYPEQKVYYFKTDAAAPLIADNQTTYELEAVINGGQFTIKGKTTLVSGMFINTPKESNQFNFANNDVAENGYASTAINVNTGNASKIEINLTVEFNEFIGTTLFATKSFIWKVGEFEGEDLTGDNISAVASGSTFYELIKQNASNNDQITKRQLKQITVSEYGAGEDLQKYLLVNKPSTSLTQSKPVYTNLTATGENRVLGVFSSKGSAQLLKTDWKYITGSTYYRCLNPNSVKELCTGTITGSLLFCTDHPNDSGLTYFCN